MVGAVQVESSSPIALETTQFHNPRTYEVRYPGFKPLLSQIQLVPLRRGERRGVRVGAGGALRLARLRAHLLAGGGDSHRVRRLDRVVE